MSNQVEGESLEQGAVVAETPEPQTDSQNAASTEQSQAAPQSDDNVPFHKHPRWQEVQERARVAEERSQQFARQLEEYQTRQSEMERRYQEQNKPQKEVSPFVEKLREIDPRYAEYIEGLEARASKVENLSKDLEQIKYDRLINQYETQVSSLHTEHKTPDAIKGMVKEQLDSLAASGRIQMRDIPATYKKLVDSYNSLLDNAVRSERAKYVQDKKVDAASPAPAPKGAPPVARNDKGQFTADREHNIALIAKRALKIARAEGDI